MDTGEIQVLITFFVLLMPFGLLWYKVFKSLKKHIRTTLNYTVLVLFSLIALTVYYVICFALGYNLIDGTIGGLIGAASFITVAIGYLLIIPTTIVTVILTIIHFATRKRVQSHSNK